MARGMEKYFDVKPLVVTRPSGESRPAYYARLLYLAGRADLVHVNSLDRAVPYIKMLYPKKAVVLHYHGSDIRGRWSEKKPRWTRADMILVSTADLLDGAPREAGHLPRIVDEELLDKYRGGMKIVRSYHWEYGAEEEAKALAESLGLEVDIQPGEEKLDHEAFIEKLSGYAYYVDVKRNPFSGEIIPARSLVGLEALYLGLSIVQFNGDIYDRFPRKNRIAEATRRLWMNYEEVGVSIMPARMDEV